MRVDNSARSGGIIRISLIFYNMKVYCVFTLESPHQGDSNEYTQYTIFQYEKEKNTLNYPKSSAMGFFPRDSRTSIVYALFPFKGLSSLLYARYMTILCPPTKKGVLHNFRSYLQGSRSGYRSGASKTVEE